MSYGASRYLDVVTIECSEVNHRHIDVRQGGGPMVLPNHREPEDTWADEEIGRAYRLAKGGWDTGLIAETMDIPVAEVAQKLTGMLEVLARRKIVSSRSRRGTQNGKTGRPKQISVEQEKRIMALYRNHKGVAAIARNVGVGEGCVKYVIEARE